MKVLALIRKLPANDPYQHLGADNVVADALSRPSPTSGPVPTASSLVSLSPSSSPQSLLAFPLPFLSDSALSAYDSSKPVCLSPR